MNLKPITDFISTILGRYGISYFFGLPADTMTFWVLLSLAVAFLVFVGVYGVYLTRKARKLPPYKFYGKTFFWYNLSLVLLALIHLFGRYENLALLSWRFWMYLLLAIIIAFNGWFFVKRKQQLEDELEAFADKKRKDKWLRKKK